MIGPMLVHLMNDIFLLLIELTLNIDGTFLRTRRERLPNTVPYIAVYGRPASIYGKLHSLYEYIRYRI